jgi:hypothetical protein
VPATVGDFVFVARGAVFPFILRPIGHDETFEETKKTPEISTFYRFVGGAYVHGVMDGQVWKKMEAEGQSDEAIFLL